MVVGPGLDAQPVGALDLEGKLAAAGGAPQYGGHLRRLDGEERDHRVGAQYQVRRAVEDQVFQRGDDRFVRCLPASEAVSRSLQAALTDHPKDRLQAGDNRRSILRLAQLRHDAQRARVVRAGARRRTQVRRGRRLP
jgi:hypothetical protein